MSPETAVTINWKLNEHEAASLLRLMYHEMERTQEVWQPYWQNLADNLCQAIEESTLTSLRQRRNRVTC